MIEKKSKNHLTKCVKLYTQNFDAKLNKGQRSVTAVVGPFGHTPAWFLVCNKVVASMCLSLVWAPVLHTEAHQHHLEKGMIDELLRHSAKCPLSERIAQAKTPDIQR